MILIYGLGPDNVQHRLFGTDMYFMLIRRIIGSSNFMFVVSTENILLAKPDTQIARANV